MPVVCCVWIQVPPARMAQALYSVDFSPAEREALHHQFVSFQSHPADLLDFAEFLADPARVLSKDDLVDDETVCCLNSLPQAAATQYVAQLVTVLGKQFKIGAAFAEAFFPSSIPSASASHRTNTPRRKKFANLFPHTPDASKSLPSRRGGQERAASANGPSNQLSPQQLAASPGDSAGRRDDDVALWLRPRDDSSHVSTPASSAAASQLATPTFSPSPVKEGTTLPPTLSLQGPAASFAPKSCVRQSIVRRAVIRIHVEHSWRARTFQRAFRRPNVPNDIKLLEFISGLCASTWVVNARRTAVPTRRRSAA